MQGRCKDPQRTPSNNNQIHTNPHTKRIALKPSY